MKGEVETYMTAFMMNEYGCSRKERGRRKYIHKL